MLPPCYPVWLLTPALYFTSQAFLHWDLDSSSSQTCGSLHFLSLCLQSANLDFQVRNKFQILDLHFYSSQCTATSHFLGRQNWPHDLNVFVVVQNTRKLDEVALLITDPPPASSIIMHRWLVRQGRTLCLDRNSQHARSNKIYLITGCVISYHWGFKKR